MKTGRGQGEAVFALLLPLLRILLCLGQAGQNGGRIHLGYLARGGKGQ